MLLASKSCSISSDSVTSQCYIEIIAAAFRIVCFCLVYKMSLSPHDLMSILNRLEQLDKLKKFTVYYAQKNHLLLPLSNFTVAYSHLL